MENLSREAILRMVGLHDAAHMMRQMNAIQLSLEEEQGKMVAYWTEIRKSEKEVTLLAGRMTTAETNIGQLQVTAQQITASVSSLTTTVNGHTTSIGQLTITANQLTASVSTISDTVNGHTTSIGQLQITSNSISNRVTVIEGDYVKEAEISLMVKKDGSGYISNALIKADDIDFVFTRAVSWYWQSKTEANKRMGLDSSGDLWISGEYRGGTITQSVQVGTGTKKMFIEPTSTGARLVGKDGSTEVLSLGFSSYDGRYIPMLKLGSATYREQGSHFSDGSNGLGRTVDIEADGLRGPTIYTTCWGTNNTVRLSIGCADGYIDIRGYDINYSSVNAWPSINQVSIGGVYLDNGYLKVRTS